LSRSRRSVQEKRVGAALRPARTDALGHVLGSEECGTVLRGGDKACEGHGRSRLLGPRWPVSLARRHCGRKHYRVSPRRSLAVLAGPKPKNCGETTRYFSEFRRAGKGQTTDRNCLENKKISCGRRGAKGGERRLPPTPRLPGEKGAPRRDGCTWYSVQN